VREFREALAGAVVLCILAVVFMSLFGCSTLGRERRESPQDAGDVAQEAACGPFPVCEIPPGASSKQLNSALWGCVLEMRAQWSKCLHLVNPVPMPQLPEVQGYRVAREKVELVAMDIRYPEGK
jgi:hypothetical protein